MSGHTPGPWEVERGSEISDWPWPITITAPSCRVVRMDPWAYGSMDEAPDQVDAREGNEHFLGNARLIAAAPDLYREAVKVVEWLDRLAANSVRQSTDSRFPSLAEAMAKDALNYLKSAEGLREAIAKAEPAA